jgi:CHAT domain-containing protein/Tfp pilus assembly protein PilF
VKSITECEQAAKVAKQAGSSVAAAWLYELLAAADEAEEKWKDAAAFHLVAWELLEHGDDRAAQSRALAGLGRCNRKMNDFQTAEQWWARARDVDQAAGYEAWKASDITNLGHVFFSRGDLQQARKNYAEALEIRQRLMPDSKEVAASLSDLGVIAAISSDYSLAEDYARRALVIREHLAPGSLEVCDSLNNLGILARKRGDLSAARDYLSRALAIRERLIPDSEKLAGTLDNLGLVALDAGELEEAEKFQRRALAIFERLAPGSLDVAASYNNLGLLARARGDVQTAFEYHSRDLAITQKLAPDSVDLGTSLNNVGLIFLDRGDLDSAQDYLGRSLAIFQRVEPDSLDVAGNLENLAQVAIAKSDFKLAQRYFKQALDLREQLAPDTLKVAENLDNSAEIARHLGDLATARQLHEQSSILFEQVAPRSLEFSANLTNFGILSLQEKDFTHAREYFERAIGIVEAQRVAIASAEARALLIAQHTRPYIGLMQTFIALGDIPAAFTVSERARARSLLDSLAESHADIRRGISPDLLERERSLQQALNGKARRHFELISEKHDPEQAAAMSREIDSLVVQYDQLESEIKAQDPRYAAFTHPPLSYEEVRQRLLDDNTLLIEYALGEDAGHAFVVDSNGIKHYQLPGRLKVEQTAREVYSDVTSRNFRPRAESVAQRQSRIRQADSKYSQKSLELSRMLLGPTADALGKRRIVVVPDGALWSIPFGALPDPVAKSWSNLITQHEIIMLPSASVLGAQRETTHGRTDSPKKLAIFADPVFEADDPRVVSLERELLASKSNRAALKHADTASGSLAPEELRRAVDETEFMERGVRIRRLPFSREEAEAIFALSPKDALKAVDFDASRDHLMRSNLGEYQFLHFATHALVNNEHPQLSGIVLSLIDTNAQPVDGFLRLNEIYNLNLKADLVVLSACQTALGKEIKGEGLIGLTRGFMHAGASRVIASLWKVDDEATSELMRRFYGHIFRDRPTIGDALRQAQLEMSRQTRWRSPYFWAGFVIEGEWN